METRMSYWLCVSGEWVLSQHRTEMSTAAKHSYSVLFVTMVHLTHIYIPSIIVDFELFQMLSNALLLFSVLIMSLNYHDYSNSPGAVSPRNVLFPSDQITIKLRNIYIESRHDIINWLPCTLASRIIHLNIWWTINGRWQKAKSSRVMGLNSTFFTKTYRQKKKNTIVTCFELQTINIIAENCFCSLNL